MLPGTRREGHRNTGTPLGRVQEARPHREKGRLSQHPQGAGGDPQGTGSHTQLYDTHVEPPAHGAGALPGKHWGIFGSCRGL